MKWEESEKTDFMVALDIGTTKVCAIVGRRNDLQQVEILGFGRVAGDGVQRGVVTNIDKTVKAIQEAVQKAERQIGQSIDRVSVGIAGQHIASRQNHGMITREDDIAEITQLDIDELITSMRKLPLKPGEEILHIIPQDFAVDDEWGITEPIGMCGTRLGANFHIITCQKLASKNIMRCVEKANLKVTGLTLEPIASSASVLTEADRREGVVLVDIGGGTTDITIFADGVISHTCVLPFGGDVITSDVRQVFQITPADAEDLKTKFGNALASEAATNRYIRIANRRGQQHTEISEGHLAEVIEVRMEEILRYIDFQISLSNVRDRLQGGIVLTGGGSLLKNIDKLTEFFTGIPTRIGLPVEHLAQGYDSELSSPIFATSIGLLIGGIDRADRVSVNPNLAEELSGESEDKSQDNLNGGKNALEKASTSTVTNDGEVHSANEASSTWFSKAQTKVVSSLKTWFDADEDPDML
ncbi:MAG: cell division protein FtsA [Saprospiraceae bacterium]